MKHNKSDELLITCKTCNHFCQHYSKTKDEFFTVACGHCMYPQIKKRDQYCKACDNYEKKPAD